MRARLGPWSVRSEARDRDIDEAVVDLDVEAVKRRREKNAPSMADGLAMRHDAHMEPSLDRSPA
jgi:hypothetical protein